MLLYSAFKFRALQGCDRRLAEVLAVWQLVRVLYFVDRASRYKFLLMTNLTHFFMYLFILSIYMFRASQCSS